MTVDLEAVVKGSPNLKVTVMYGQINDEQACSGVIAPRPESAPQSPTQNHNFWRKESHNSPTLVESAGSFSKHSLLASLLVHGDAWRVPLPAGLLTFPPSTPLHSILVTSSRWKALKFCRHHSWGSCKWLIECPK
jgi:hypothetical protein